MLRTNCRRASISQKLATLWERLAHYERRPRFSRDGTSRCLSRPTVHAHLTKDAKSAENAYLEAINLAPDLPDGHYFLARLKLTSGSISEAISLLERAIGLAHTASAAALQTDVSVQHCRTELAGAYVKDGQTEKEAQSRVLAVSREALLASLSSCTVGGDAGEAAESTASALRQEAERLAKAEYALAIDHEKRDEWSDAADHFSAATALSPSWALAHARLAQSLQAQGKLSEAMESYGAALAISPADPIAQYNMGVSARALGQHAIAADRFERAETLVPNDGKLPFNAAVSHKEAGDLAKSEAAYRRAIALGDRAYAPRAYYNLGNLMRDEAEAAVAAGGGGEGGEGGKAEGEGGANGVEFTSDAEANGVTDSAAARAAEAAACYEAAIELEPSMADAYQQLRRIRGVENAISTPANQPLVVRRPLGLPSADVAKLRADVLAHPWAANPNRLSASFRGTRGFVVRFNRDGFEKSFARHPQLKCLVPYFEHAVRSDANVFVMNVLVVPPKPQKAAQEGEGARGRAALAVQAHLDNTLAICTLESSFLAHQVDVCYLALPSGMQGGELCVWQPSKSSGPQNSGLDGPPDEIVTPEEGMHVTFRGDAKHGVRAWSAAADATGADGEQVRVSLVLEQYLVPERLYTHSTEFEVVGV